MFYKIPDGREVPVLQGDRVVTKVGGVNAIVIAKDPDKEERVIMFAIETREKFVCNIGLLVFVSRGRVPRNSGPRVNTRTPVYANSFRAVHPFDQVVSHKGHKVGIVKSINPDQTIEFLDMDCNTFTLSVFEVSLVQRDNGLMQQLKELVA